MLTAGHCRPWGNTFDNFTDGGGDVMGNSSHQAHFRDTVLIDTRVAGRIYTGNFDSSASRPGQGLVLSFVGDSVCDPPASHNQMCSLKSSRITSPSPLFGRRLLVGRSDGGGGTGQRPAGPAANGDKRRPGCSSFRNDGGVNARGSYSADDDGRGAVHRGADAARTYRTTACFYADIVFTIIFYKATLVTG